MSREAAERVAGALPHGTLGELPGAFHHLIVDDPSGFVERVEAWLATLSPADRPHGGPPR